MAVVIRLHGLRITAGPEDIRRFFTGLKIPDGGVRIIGGDLEEAFITFASIEDARRAMSRSGGCIKGAEVNLLLSSKSEMQKVLEASTKKPEASARKAYKNNGRPADTNPGSLRGKPSGDVGNRSMPAGGLNQSKQPGKRGKDPLVLYLFGMSIYAKVENILKFFTGLRVNDIFLYKNSLGLATGSAMVKFETSQDAAEGLKRHHKYMGSQLVRIKKGQAGKWQKAVGRERELELERQKHSERESKDSLYLYVSGMHFSTKDEDIRRFFTGLRVNGIFRYTNTKGMHCTAMVKFETSQDAAEGLKMDRKYMGFRNVRVRPGTEDKCLEAGGREQEGERQREREMEREREAGRGRERETLVGRRREREWDREPVVDATGSTTKPSSTYTSRKSVPERARSRSPRRSRTQSPSKEEFCVMVDNLSLAVEKADLKQFFHSTALCDNQIIHVTDKYGKRTRSAFVLFGSLRDYCAGLSHHKKELLSKPVYVSPVSKEKMIATLQSMNQQLDYAEEWERSHSAQRSPSLGREDPIGREKVCLYVRNLPFDVRKVEIMDFFHGFRITEDCLILLRDESGAGLGEALLIFQTENEAILAQSLNGQRYLGSEVMLQCITRAQMREFGI